MASYVIFGAGRVGRSMAGYLEHLGHAVSLVTRFEAEQNRQACEKRIESADVVAAAIPDSKLEGWRDAWRAVIADKTAIHFSGAINLDGVYGFHPLYSFPPLPLPPETMNEIAFACPERGPAFANVFPGASNPHFEIAAENRARYHALAVLSGNFASFLWNETAKEFASLGDIPPETILKTYFSGLVDRFAESPEASMTGPVLRKDSVTVDKNLAALAGNPKLKQLYEAFLTAAWPDFTEGS